MREIKFRGIKKDGTFAYGHLLSDSAIGKWGNSEYYTYAEIDPITVGQYTGLKDKNGVEIYEGDICTKMISPDENNLAPRELHRGEIVFHHGGFCYKSGDYYYPMSRTHGVIDVIGNIHQNPDLLK